MHKISKHLHNFSLILSALVLVFTATMLRGTVGKISDYFSKEIVSTRKPLNDFLSSVESIEKDFKWDNLISTQEIETDEYFMITFRPKEQSATQPVGCIHAAYYSDPGSKVPHTPDVCYRQAGATIKEIRTIQVDLLYLIPKFTITFTRLVVWSSIHKCRSGPCQWISYNIEIEVRIVWAVLDILVKCVRGQFGQPPR